MQAGRINRNDAENTKKKENKQYETEFNRNGVRHDEDAKDKTKSKEGTIIPHPMKRVSRGFGTSYGMRKFNNNTINGKIIK